MSHSEEAFRSSVEPASGGQVEIRVSGWGTWNVWLEVESADLASRAGQYDRLTELAERVRRLASERSVYYAQGVTNAANRVPEGDPSSLSAHVGHVTP